MNLNNLIYNRLLMFYTRVVKFSFTDTIFDTKLSNVQKKLYINSLIIILFFSISLFVHLFNKYKS